MRKPATRRTRCRRGFTPARAPRAPRKGVVLLAVLIVVVFLTLAAYQFTELMQAEVMGADTYVRMIQARAMAESGVHYAAAVLSNQDAFSNVLGGNPYDNAAAFQGKIVQANDVARFQGRFSILALATPDEGSSTGFRFGVTDESGRINLNALLKLDSSGQVAHDMLMRLPNMTEDIANAILDWIDPDDDPRPSGAESDYYTSQSPPYRCKNGPLDSLEELLLVRGVTPQLLFGNDKNRNGILDSDEGTGDLDQGWSAYLTVYSRERNLDVDYNPRIYINDSDLTSLQQKLTDAVGSELANYIIAYRMYGPAQTGQGGSGGGGSSAGGAGGGSMAGGGSSAGGSTGRTGGTSSSSGSTSANRGTSQSALTAPTQPTVLTSTNRASISTQITTDMANASQRRARSISSLYELVNSTVSVPSGSSTTTAAASTSARGGATVTVTATQQQTTTPYPSPLNDPSSLRQLLPLLLDKVTTVRDTELPARVNVNTAPRTVLLSLPGLSDADVQTIIEHRPGPSDGEAPDPIFQTPAWLVTEANLSTDTLRTLERYVTARSTVYRVQSMGYFDGGGPTARVEAVIDTNAGRPRIIYWRDLTELGKGFDLQTGQ